MASPELIELWKKIVADLQAARRTLPPGAETDHSIRDYQENLDHNELELACNLLETYEEEHLVSREFWLALRDAGVKMQLHDCGGLREACEFVVERVVKDLNVRSRDGKAPGFHPALLIPNRSGMAARLAWPSPREHNATGRD